MAFHRASGFLAAIVILLVPQICALAASGRHPTNDSDELQDLSRRDNKRYVFMHHIVGNTFPYTPMDWSKDLSEISSKGVDAVALNIGRDQWQFDQLKSAYSTARSSSTKLFISFDFTSFVCDANEVIRYVKYFAQSYPSGQFFVQGRPLISAFGPPCLGPDKWDDIKRETGGFLMPFIWELEGKFSSWQDLDSWQCWGCAWPQGNYAKTTDDDYYYMDQLGKIEYAATVSPWFFTHYSNKNRYLRGDDWLFVTRWEQLYNLRNAIRFVELATWNDYGESHYLGPIRGQPPPDTPWIDGFPHGAWFDMAEYYIRAYKTGSWPAITKDVIYWWSRPHFSNATASADSLGKPDGANWAGDFLWAVVFATSPSTVTLKVGRSSSTTNVQAGVTKLKVPLDIGSVTIQMIKSSRMVINVTPSDFKVVASPRLYNFNAYVGSAVANIPRRTVPNEPSDESSDGGILGL